MAKAQFWLYKMMDRLSQEGLGLNSYKTRVIESRTVMFGSTPAADASTDVTKFKAVRPVLIGPDPDERGFYTRVPRRFVLPDTGEMTKPPRRAEDVVADLLAKTVVEPPEFRDLAIALLVFGDFSALPSLPKVLQKHPPYIDYAMGMLAHFGDSVPKPIRVQLAKDLGVFLCSPHVEIPEWHKLQIATLLGTREYENRDALQLLLRNMPRHAGAALGRGVLDALYNVATRGDALEIKEFFERSDSAERRAILRILDKVLPEEEKRAWRKYASQQLRDDPFAVHLVKPFRAKGVPVS
jgi:hypothetical protein